MIQFMAINNLPYSYSKDLKSLKKKLWVLFEINKNYN